MDYQTSSSSSDSDDDYVFERRRKIYRERVNNLENYDDLDFFTRFRITKQTFHSLMEAIEHLIATPTNRGGSIKPVNQVLLTLRFYALGCMQKAVADFVGVSIPSACRIISKVSNSIASLHRQLIKMYDTNEEMGSSATKFYKIARFPRVIGSIDCTLIKIDSPGGDDAEIFRTRKNFFGVNVQTVSDSDLKITDIVARWPGSCHAQTIFNNSRLKRRFEDGEFGTYMLVGDSGYNVKPYLMTKLQETHTLAENLYNEFIIRTRCVVERQYGVWKRRFPILKLGMQVKLETIFNIIVATAVLHNMAIEENEDIPEEWLNEEENDIDLLPQHHNDNHLNNIRQLLILNHFARL